MFFNTPKRAEKVCPKTRSKDLLFQEFENELLIYDLETDKAYNLNSEAAHVWSRCDGTKTITQIAESIESEENMEIGVDHVRNAVAQFQEMSLTESNVVKVRRREALRNMATAAVGVPVILSLAVPAAAQAASCIPAGGFCNIDPDCCSGFCAEGFCGAPELTEIESIEIDVDKLRKDKEKKGSKKENK